MTSFENRLREVAGYFSAGDTHLGYRRLLDAAIETNNFTIYEETLRFCDWYDALPADNPDTQTLAGHAGGVGIRLEMYLNIYTTSI